jgi:hypothetical protein
MPELIVRSRGWRATFDAARPRCLLLAHYFAFATTFRLIATRTICGVGLPRQLNRRRPGFRTSASNNLPRQTNKVGRSLPVAVSGCFMWVQLAFARHLTPLPHPVGVPGKPLISAANRAATTSPWTPLANQPSFLVDGAANPILLTDGTVLVQDAGFPDWWRLTPDQKGSWSFPPDKSC